jgi:hypothetical protein
MSSPLKAISGKMIVFQKFLINEFRFIINIKLQLINRFGGLVKKGKIFTGTKDKIRISDVSISLKL